MNPNQQIIDHIRNTTPKSTRNTRGTMPEEGCAFIAVMMAVGIIVLLLVVVGITFF